MFQGVPNQASLGNEAAGDAGLIARMSSEFFAKIPDSMIRSGRSQKNLH